ncbi:MAG TPA: hypothetical protein VFY84_09195 [Jiangellales bacterium]|nr:hypothetical protein [Jiangellales bacterium]
MPEATLPSRSSWAHRLMLIYAALTAAVALGAFGGYLGWQTARPLPSDAEALRLVGPALAPGASAQPQRWDFVFDENPKYTDPRWVFLVAGTDEYRAGKVFYQFGYPHDSSPKDVVTRAEQRMLAAGWQSAGRLSRDLSGCCPSAAVHRDSWFVEIFSEGYLDDSHYGLQVAVLRTPPALVLPLTTAGLLAGALGGWLLAAWAIRRLRTSRPAHRAVMVLTGAGAAALIPATGLSALALVGTYLARYDPTPAWAGYTFLLARPLAYLGAAAVVAGLVVAAAAPRSAPQQAVVR